MLCYTLSEVITAVWVVILFTAALMVFWAICCVAGKASGWCCHIATLNSLTQQQPWVKLETCSFDSPSKLDIILSKNLLKQKFSIIYTQWL